VADSGVYYTPLGPCTPVSCGLKPARGREDCSRPGPPGKIVGKVRHCPAVPAA